MLTEEDLDRDHEVRPEWLRIPEAIKRFGMSRTKLYELISEQGLRK